MSTSANYLRLKIAITSNLLAAKNCFRFVAALLEDLCSKNRHKFRIMYNRIENVFSSIFGEFVRYS